MLPCTVTPTGGAQDPVEDGLVALAAPLQGAQVAGLAVRGRVHRVEGEPLQPHSALYAAEVRWRLAAEAGYLSR